MDGIIGMKRSTISTLAALAMGAALALGPASAQQAPAPQAQAPQAGANVPAATMEKLARFRHVKLTEEKAKAALEVFLKLQEAYPPETFLSKKAGPEGTEEARKAVEKAKEVLALMKEKGFSDIDDWGRTFTSLGMAIAYVREGGKETLKKRLDRINAAPMPEPVKARARIMLLSLVPPKQNQEVVQKLLANPETKKMIEAVEKLPLPQQQRQ